MKRPKKVSKGMAAKRERTARPHVINAETKGLRVNAIECPKCSSMLFSRASRDYRECSCGEVAVDGGFEYLKVSYKNKMPKVYEIWIPVSIKELYEDWNKKTDLYGFLSKDLCKAKDTCKDKKSKV